MEKNNIPNVVASKPSEFTVPRTDVDKICLVDADFLKYLVTDDVAKYISKKKDPIEEFGFDYMTHFVYKRIDNMILSKINAKAFVFLFSAPSKKTFRYAMAIEKEYKGNRSTPEPKYEMQFQDMANVVPIVKERYTTFVKPDLEADDLLGVFQSKDTFIYSQDKDSRTVPGLHWDIKTNRLINVAPGEALKFLMYQMLRGDGGDNIAGFPGMGEVKTSEFLHQIDNVTKLPEKVFFHYMQSFGISEGIDRFCENWMLLKMRPNRGTYFLSKLETEINIINQLIKTNE